MPDGEPDGMNKVLWCFFAVVLPLNLKVKHLSDDFFLLLNFTSQMNDQNIIMPYDS